MRVKKYMVAACIWFIVLCVGVISKPSDLTFEIHYDSNLPANASIKNEVLARYAQLIRGLHEESEVVLLLQNLDLFMWEEDMQATWEDNALRITIGDGKGAVIHGDLDPQERCLPEVKTKSLLQEWFGNV